MKYNFSKYLVAVLLTVKVLTLLPEYKHNPKYSFKEGLLNVSSNCK